MWFMHLHEHDLIHVINLMYSHMLLNFLHVTCTCFSTRHQQLLFNISNLKMPPHFGNVQHVHLNVVEHIHLVP